MRTEFPDVDKEGTGIRCITRAKPQQKPNQIERAIKNKHRIWLMFRQIVKPDKTPRILKNMNAGNAEKQTYTLHV